MREKYCEHYFIKNIKLYFDKYILPDILRYMYSIQSFFVKITPKYISWDRAGQSDISEISERERGEMLEDRLKRDFPIDRFLTLYREWESATESGEKTRLFALLRDLHQSAGVNKKSIAIWADREMHIFGQYVSDIADLRQRSKVKLRDRSIQPIEFDRWELERNMPKLWVGPISTDITLNVEPEKKIVSEIDPLIPKKRFPPKKKYSQPTVREEQQEPIVDFSGEQEKVTKIQKKILGANGADNIFHPLNVELNRNFTGTNKTFLPLGSSYLQKPGSNMIEAAIIRQSSDGEYYIFDTVENSTRKVYRLNQIGEVIGSIVLRSDGSLLESKWKKMKWVLFIIPSPKLEPIR